VHGQFDFGTDPKLPCFLFAAKAGNLMLRYEIFVKSEKDLLDTQQSLMETSTMPKANSRLNGNIISTEDLLR